MLGKKYPKHQQILQHVFLDFKKTFDRVRQQALWATMKKYNIGQKLINTFQQLYHEAKRAMSVRASKGEWFCTSTGVRQGCLLSSTLFNIFLERIMTVALEDHIGTVSIGRRIITNMRFADDIDGLTESE